MGVVVHTRKGHRCLGNGRCSWILGSTRKEGLELGFTDSFEWEGLEPGLLGDGEGSLWGGKG